MLPHQIARPQHYSQNGDPGMRSIMRRAVAAGIAGSAIVTLAAISPTVAVAASTSEAAGIRTVCFEQMTCYVTANNVNFRSGPGINYPSLGQVHAGQGFDTVELSGDWFRGNLWGGPSNVWIHASYLNYQ